MACCIICFVQLLAYFTHKTRNCESTEDSNCATVSSEPDMLDHIFLPNSCSSAPVSVASSTDEIGLFASAMILNNFKSMATLAHMYVEG
jgi:hypothetical protein